MEDLKNKLEAILFSVGKKISLEELSKLCKINNPNIVEAKLKELQQGYEQKESSMMLVSEKDIWKLTVRERYMPLIKNLAIDTELNKSVTETLAILAFKYPILQSELIKIRSNKAYDHIKQLQEMQFLEKIKKGRTYELKLTSKFFNYFDLPEDKVKETFKNFEEVEQSIEEKEKDMEEQIKQVEQANRKTEEMLRAKRQEQKNNELKEIQDVSSTEVSEKDDEEVEVGKQTTQQEGEEEIKSSSEALRNIEE
ncbi:SMC-Scp complex subunit ScpB [Candidatus Woesearchaeota archaeon]|nr:SMC-Scp complex subunit ScpB [Candidatus Woesearchaeota archaeon]MBL7050664.1 SMC-Scp complex subunit ScpB [Candidatus Woesearchaeota archaeon]